ncbi:hypothetical protein BUALT_Bualt04G0017500 [Buddleja alternifolia]|uniref:UBC core domain-containing protein n=1 Tax=Buddleja alternifolia TaxID=168488 RepID=A0AAV6XLV4_9LAMI|nr:hypothetical protein BUALT_Bualt04G0017500 [Buddleja alternifolia]
MNKSARIGEEGDLGSRVWWDLGGRSRQENVASNLQIERCNVQELGAERGISVLGLVGKNKFGEEQKKISDFGWEISRVDDGEVRFQTKIFHTNISSNGSISIAILREYWLTGITMLKMLGSIRSMLIEPILDKVHPDVPTIIEMYKNDRAMYESTAQSWTKLYARK